MDEAIALPKLEAQTAVSALARQRRSSHDRLGVVAAVKFFGPYKPARGIYKEASIVDHRSHSCDITSQG
jgi:hypothetical protein